MKYAILHPEQLAGMKDACRKMYETWYKMMSLVEAGFDLTPVITHRFHYTDFEKGFAAMNSGKSGKVVLSWT